MLQINNSKVLIENPHSLDIPEPDEKVCLSFRPQSTAQTTTDSNTEDRDASTTSLTTIAPLHASLICASVNFTRRAFSVFSVATVVHLFASYVPHCGGKALRKALRSRFDQPPEELLPSCPPFLSNLLDAGQTLMLYELAFISIVTLLASSQKRATMRIVGLLGHADFLLAQRNFFSLMESRPLNENEDTLSRYYSLDKELKVRLADYQPHF